jgi:Lrp/AsnC family transcriptional regulator, leucine-responsive regulatory protein
MSIKNDIDDINSKIIQLLQDDPTLTHSAIAKKLKRSQPAIGARIKKLIRKGYLATQIGIDFGLLNDITLVRVDMATTRSEDVMELALFCPYCINTLKMTGQDNICIFLASSNMKRIDAVLDRHFRDKPYVKSIKMERMLDSNKKFVMPMDFLAELNDSTDDPCDANPICRAARAAAAARSPEEINLV